MRGTDTLTTAFAVDSAGGIAERVRAAMEGVTPGPWAVDGYSIDAVIFMPAGKSHVSDWRCLLKCATADGHWRQNAAYIALCSPDNIGALLDLIASLRSDRDAAVEALRPFAALYDAMADSLKTDSDEVWGYNDATLTKGHFRRARTTLASMGGDDA